MIIEVSNFNRVNRIVKLLLRKRMQVVVKASVLMSAELSIED